MTETDKPARRNKRILLTILGGLALIGVTAAATVAIEHRLHEEDAGHEAHGHDEHGHDEHGEGEQGHDEHGGDERGAAPER